MEPDPCKIYYCYKATNNVNGKMYIGFAGDPQQRWREHKRDAATGRGFAFHAAIRKYGWEHFQFEVICCGKNKKEMLEYVEPALIEQYNSSISKQGYNMCRSMKGGTVSLDINPLIGKPRSEETKRKISETKHKFPYHHTEEVKIKMRHPTPSKSNSKSLWWRITNQDGETIEVKNLEAFRRQHSIKSHRFAEGKMCNGYFAMRRDNVSRTP
jgi:group I intron endonuclease